MATMTRFLLRLSTYVAALTLTLTFCALILGKILPSSGQLVYVAFDEQAVMRLWGHDLQHNLVTSIARDAYVAAGIFPSTDGQQIAFFKEIDLYLDLYVVNADGSNLRHVPVTVSSSMGITWLAGTYEIIVANASGSRQRINVFNMDDSTPLQPDTAICGLPIFASNGRRVAAQAFETLETEFLNCYGRGWLIADVDSVSNVAELGSSEAQSAVVWSPDNTRLALLSLTGRLLIASDSPNPNITQLMRSGATLNSPPIWSPDGTQIALIVGGTFDLSIIPAQANSTPTTFPSPQTVETFPAWSPDGTEIAFSSSGRNVFADIYILNIASGEIRRVTHTPVNEANIVWLP